MKYEVRCCCEPEKLLGWLDLGGVALPPSQRDLYFPPRLACPSRFMRAGETLEILEDRPAIRLEVGELVPACGNRLPISGDCILGCRPGECSRRGAGYPALKAHGVTIEQLRKLPGFTPA